MSFREFTTILKLRKTQGFSAIQIVIGIPPEVEPFDENAKNSGGFPFNKDWSLNPAYFAEVDRKVQAIVDAGLVPVLFGGWGNHIDWMGVEHLKQLWCEIIARYAAFPVIFSLAGEVDVFLVPGGIDAKQADTIKTKTKKYLELLPRPVFDLIVKAKRLGSYVLYRKYEQKLLRERLKKWSDIGVFISNTDPFGRILTAHPNRQVSAFDLFGNPSWLTLNSIQSGHSLETLPFMIRAIQKSRKPIINLEPWYEGIAGNFDSYYQRVAFWACILSGAVGHGYGAHGIWQFSKSDNFMRHWGESDAGTAIGFAGASQLGLAKDYLVKKEFFAFFPDNSIVLSENVDKNALLAYTGKTETATFVYIPDQRHLVYLKLNKAIRKKLITVIDPETMRKIKTMQIAGQIITMPIDNSVRDLLLVIE